MRVAMPTSILAVLFDLDGTLVDNMSAHVEAWIETGRALGEELTREQILRDFSGRRNEEIFPLFIGRPLAAEEVAELAERKEARYRELFAPHLRPVTGAEAFIDRLQAHGIAVGVASAAPRKNREFVLDGLGLTPRLRAIVGGDEVAHGKPAPDIFLEGARRIGSEPAHTLVFEDAVLGVQAARAAGMTVCGITTVEPGEALLEAGARYTAPNYAELPAALTSLLWR